MKSLALALVLFTTFSFSSAYAHEEGETGRLKGPGVSLLWKDHNLTGQVGGKTVAAASLEKEFGMIVTHRVRGREFRAELKKVDQRIGGTLESLDRFGRPVRTTVEVTGVDAAKGLITGKLGGKSFAVKVSASSMDGHHFVAPVFDVKVGTRPYRFHMEGGMACMGCAVKISMVVLSLLQVSGAF